MTRESRENLFLPLPPDNHRYNRTPQLNFAHVPHPRPSPPPPRFLTGFCNDAHHTHCRLFHPAPPTQPCCRSSQGYRGCRPLTLWRWRRRGRGAILPPLVAPLAAAFPRSASRNRKVLVQLSPIRSCLPPPLPSLCPFLPLASRREPLRSVRDWGRSRARGGWWGAGTGLRGLAAGLSPQPAPGPEPQSGARGFSAALS